MTLERETKDVFSTDDDGNTIPFMIIPVGFLKEQILPDKFNAYEKMFNMFMYAEKTVKLKWYQTGIFRILFMFVGIIFAAITLGVTAALTMATIQFAGMILQAIDPRLAAILGLAFAIFTFNPAQAFSSLINVANKILNVFSSFANP